MYITQIELLIYTKYKARKYFDNKSPDTLTLLLLRFKEITEAQTQAEFPVQWSPNTNCDKLCFIKDIKYHVQHTYKFS